MGAVTGFGIIENAGPNHLRGFLTSAAKQARGIDVAVAFVTQKGLAGLLPVLKRASLKAPVRILTGLYQGFTEPQALRALLRQQRDTEGRLSVRLSTNSHFHWKVYLLRKRRSVTAVIGSSNLTSEGLQQSGELNAAVTLRRSSSAFKLVQKHFDEEWKQAVPLTKERIDQYAKKRPPRVPHPSIPLKDILGTVQKRKRWESAGKDRQQPQFWRQYITGYVSDATEQVIADTTDWDNKGHFWYSSGEPRHRRGDEIILFDHSDGWVRLVRVVDTTCPPGGTPDGRQFTAYKIVPRSHRRRLDKALLADLVSVGLLKKRADATQAKKLTAKASNSLCQHLALR